MKKNTFKRAIERGIDKRVAQMWPVQGSTEMLDRTKYVTASEVGQCMRKTKLDKIAMIESGYIPAAGTKSKSSDDWGFWERGHNVEAWVVDHVIRGWDPSDGTLLYTGKHQVSFALGKQSGTPDGAIVDYMENTVRAVDFKSIDPRTNVSRLPKLGHIDQVIQNVDLMAEALDKSPVGGVLLYVDASDYKKQYEFVIDWDEVHAERLETRANTIMDSDPEDLKPEGLFMDKGCDYCAHTATCSAMIRKERNGESYDQELKAASGKIFG